MSYYTLHDFDTLIFNGITSTISSETIQRLQELQRKIGTPVDFNKPQKYDTKSRYDRKQNTPHSHSVAVPFKTTELHVVRAGLEKDVADIRVSLNKLSSKNYVAQRDFIYSILHKYISKISKAKELDDDSNSEEEEEETPNFDEENCDKILTTILDICSTTSFQPELNATLFYEIVSKLPEPNQNKVKTMIEEFIRQYMYSYSEYETDEEKQNKQNDRRKSITNFLFYLCKKSSYLLMTCESLWFLVLELLANVESDILIKEKSREVENITENLYLFFTLGKSVFSQQSNWYDVYDRICILSEYGTKEKPGLTSRALCRWKDVMDFL